MTDADLRTLTVERLVERFVAIALAQYNALEMDDTQKYNRLFDQMTAVRKELKKRPGDQRQALIALLEHPNPQVRLIAARTTLPIARAAAQQALQLMKDRQEFPQAADASWTLRILEEKDSAKAPE